MLTTRQAAEQLGVTPRQVRRYLDAGLLQGQQLGDYSTAPWAISEESVARLQEARVLRSQTGAQHIAPGATDTERSES